MASARLTSLGQGLAGLGRGQRAVGHHGHEDEAAVEGHAHGPHRARAPSVAATRPPTTEAAAFSGWPSMRAATPSGSFDPAAAAAATARAAEDPRPRATGMSERTVTARRSWPDHVDGHPGGQVHGVLFEVRTLALGPDRQAWRGLHLDLDVEVERHGQDVEAGAEVGRRSGGPGAHGRQGSAVPAPAAAGSAQDALAGASSATGRARLVGHLHRDDDPLVRRSTADSVPTRVPAGAPVCSGARVNVKRGTWPGPGQQVIGRRGHDRDPCVRPRERDRRHPAPARR